MAPLDYTEREATGAKKNLAFSPSGIYYGLALLAPPDTDRAIGAFPLTVFALLVIPKTRYPRVYIAQGASLWQDVPEPPLKKQLLSPRMRR